MILKKFSTRLFMVGMLAFAITSIGLTQTTYADVASACKNYPATPEKEICEAAYKGTASACSTYDIGSSKLAACTAGINGAAKDKQANGQTPATGGNNPQNGGTQNTGKCGGAKTEIISCDEGAGVGAIGSIIKIAIMVLTILIGIVAVGGITYAAILYASSRDNQGQVQQAIGIIRNVVIGLVMYGLSIAIVNWLVPGGVIG